MRATRELKYAVHGLFDLAYNGRGGPVKVQEIGERHGIPARFLEQIFQKLRRAGLVESKRGPGGGYALARAPDRLSVADVVRALQGEVLATGDAPDGGQDLDFVWERVCAGVERALAECTLADLCRRAAEDGVDRADLPPAMYEI